MTVVTYGREACSSSPRQLPGVHTDQRSSRWRHRGRYGHHRCYSCGEENRSRQNHRVLSLWEASPIQIWSSCCFFVPSAAERKAARGSDLNRTSEKRAANDKKKHRVVDPPTSPEHCLMTVTWHLYHSMCDSCDNIIIVESAWWLLMVWRLFGQDICNHRVDAAQSAWIRNGWNLSVLSCCYKNLSMTGFWKNFYYKGFLIWKLRVQRWWRTVAFISRDIFFSSCRETLWEHQNLSGSCYTFTNNHCWAEETPPSKYFNTVYIYIYMLREAMCCMAFFKGTVWSWNEQTTTLSSSSCISV